MNESEGQLCKKCNKSRSKNRNQISSQQNQSINKWSEQNMEGAISHRPLPAAPTEITGVQPVVSTAQNDVDGPLCDASALQSSTGS